MDFKDFKEIVIERCHQNGACLPEFRKLLRADISGDHVSFMKVLYENHRWCVNAKNIYSPGEINMVDPDILKQAGFLVQGNNPIDFSVPCEIDGILMKPYNEGWSKDKPYAELYDWNTAMERFPNILTKEHHITIANHFKHNAIGVYNDAFGALFGSLFMTFSGIRNGNTGALVNMGINGWFWSATPSASTSYSSSYLRVGSGTVGPVGGNVRANGLSVRCFVKS